MYIKIWISKIVLVVILLLPYGCKSNNDDKIINPAAHTIGEKYGGGIIFYIDGSGQHGLIAASSDQSASIQWFNGSYTATSAVDSTVGAGQLNTTAVVSIQGAGNYAASICDQLVLNGYDDWFLPSKNELNLLYQQKEIVSGFTNNFYWSSTEHGVGSAWEQNFIDGTKYFVNKNFQICVRAIRAF